jgi:uncharacterized HhH-GPD family protein
MPTPHELPFTEVPDANRLLAANPTALLIGMLLDQQFPMERAFLAPHLLAERLGRDLDPVDIAGLDDDTLESVFRGPPALHRYPGSMAKRTRALCAHIADEYDGDTAALWKSAADGDELYRRLRALPGYGEAKARVFVAVVGRRLDAAPDGWEERAADWPSIADVDSFEKVAVLREQKRALKAKDRTE